MTETSNKKNSLVYIETGNPYYVTYQNNKTVNEQDLNNHVYSRVGSLHQFLLRNTDLIKFETEHYEHNGDGYEDYGLIVKALFYVDCDQNGLENYEIIGGIDLLTSSSEKIWTIDLKSSQKLYEDTYLKNILGNQLFEQYLVDKNFNYFAENWNLKDYKDTTSLVFDSTTNHEIKDKLSFYEWLFQMLRQLNIDTIVLNPFVKSSVLDVKKREKIEYSEDNYKLLKPNVGK